jgi:hypothetical protein
MEPCSIPSQNISDNEYLGVSLRKINDNFDILEQYACEIETRIASLTAALQKLDIPLPSCGPLLSSNTCNVMGGTNGVAGITETSCVTDTREPINVSFRELTKLACTQSKKVQSLSAILVNHPIGKTIKIPSTTKVCSFIDSISPGEYIGDSFDKIINNFNTLNSRFCSYDYMVNTLSAKMCCPGQAENRQDIRNRFTLQGEGGYHWNTFNFTDRDRMYAPLSYSSKYFPEILGAAGTSMYSYTTSIGGTTYYGLSGIWRIGAGNNNQGAIFRDGNVFYTNGGHGGTASGPHMYTWIKNNFFNIKDIFMPSSYAFTYCQAILLSTGELFEIDLDARHNPPNLILNNVDKILTINQAHNSDFIVSRNDDTVWHVALKTTSSGSPSPYGANQITNLNARDIAFIQMGDPSNSCFVCLTSDPTKIYPVQTNPSRSLGTFSWLTSRSNTPITFPTLSPNEFFIDGASNEFHYVFLTNKKVHCFRGFGASYGPGSPIYTSFAHPPGVSAIQMSTCTSYSMAVQLTDGFHLLSVQGIANYDSGGGPAPYYQAYLHKDKFSIWNNLVAHLSGNRPDIFGFGVLSCCNCIVPPPSSCGVTVLALEDDTTCLELESSTGFIEL